MRLQKYLAQCGVASRREAEEFIAAGRVTVNGAVAQIGQTVDGASDAISLDGGPVAPDHNVYVLLNKPKGVITSAKDTHDRQTVIDLLSGLNERVFPVGRLDMDVSGALLLTNDGELSFRLTHPSYEVDKVYLAWVQGLVPPEAVKRLEEGVTLEDGPTAPAKVTVMKYGENSTSIRIVIHEGRKRLVKRMCAHVGHPVRDLRRLSIGTISANGLIPGEWRYLEHREVASLKRLTKLAQ